MQIWSWSCWSCRWRAFHSSGRPSRTRPRWWRHPYLCPSPSSLSQKTEFHQIKFAVNKSIKWHLTFCGVGRSTRCFSGTRWNRCDIMASNSSIEMLPFLSESKILRKDLYMKLDVQTDSILYLNICCSFVFAVPSFIIVIIKRNSVNSIYPFPFESYRLKISASSSS